MKKICFFMLLATISTSNVYAAAKSGIKAENIYFDDFENLPILKRDIKKGAFEYIPKVLKASEEKINDYYVFDKKVIVKKDLYTFKNNTFSDYEIKKENENSLLFLENVRFEAGSVLNLRTNLDKNLADFVNFHDITLDNGTLLVRIEDSSETPRFKKMPLFVLPISAEHADVHLIRPLIIGGVNYLLKSKEIEDYLLFYIEPIYSSEKEAEEYAKRENNINEKRTPSFVYSGAKLREKITVVKDKKMIWTNNVVDFSIEK